ncbi:AAA family ATPase [Uniformispora flossi]|uniref:AAA family ATPase n=1 Tax=Uniformispora flossi TaxID=3390723 RepID=UPI003C2D6DAB
MAEPQQTEIAVVRQLDIAPMSSVTPKRVRWLWKDRIPVGELTLVAGKGGIGKSTLLAEWCAWITTGQMKGEYFGEPRDVLYVVNEDSLEYTVVPRLLAAGADLSRVHRVRANIGGRWDRVMLPLDCERLHEAVKHFGAPVVFLDPLSSNLTAKKIDQDEMRGALERIRKTAEQSEGAFVGLAHTKKALTTNLLDAIMGSSEMANVSRSVMGAMRDPDADDGSIVLSQEKNNLGRLDLPSFKYGIATEWLGDPLDPDTIQTSKIVWLGKTDRTVSDMLAEGPREGGKTALAEAVDFVRVYLVQGGGQAMRGEVLRDGQKDGHSRSAIERAAKKLGVLSTASGQGAMRLWSLPVSPPDASGSPAVRE